jgi:hypothetical protein
MKNTYITFAWLLLMVSMLGFLVVGCHTMAIPKDRVEPVESFPLKAEKQGLLIAIRPVTDKTEIEESFHTSLLDKGILPILVVAKNNNPSLSFVLSRDKIAVVDRESLEVLGVGSSTTGAAIATGVGPIVTTVLGTGLATVAGAAVVLGAAAGGGLLSLGLIAGGLKMLSDAEVIEHNLAVKQFSSHTLDPGKATFGYVYFQLPKSEKSKKEYQVLVESIETATGEAFLFQFPLEYTVR